jgi:arsenite-transporting ATPase
VVLAEARRSYTTLSLYGYRVDGVVANRIFPAQGADDWRAGWVLAQDDVLQQIEQSFAGLPLWRSEYGAVEPVGVDALTALAQTLYGDDDPVATPRVRSPFEVVTVTGGVQMRLRLPFVSRDQIDLARSGDELVVTVGQYRRLLTLPAGLAKLQVVGARVDEDGVLGVRFEDPAPRAKARERVT